MISFKRGIKVKKIRIATYKKSVLILTLFSFVMGGCAMNNPYLRVNSNAEFKSGNIDNKPIPLHVFITNEKKKVTRQDDEWSPDLYLPQTRVLYHCDKKLVSSDLKTKERLLSFFAFSVLCFLPYLLPSMKIETTASDRFSVGKILNLNKSEFKIIDDTLKYELKEDFIKNINKIEGTYFITIDLYDIDNLEQRLDCTSGYNYISWNIYQLYASVGVFDIYKSHAKKPSNITHYQEIFYPERLYKTSSTTSVFETLESLSTRRTKVLSANLTNCLMTNFLNDK